MPFRVFLIGLEQEDLDLLRVRAESDPNLRIAGTALLRDVQRSTVPPPASVDGIVMSPAALKRAAPMPAAARPDSIVRESPVEELTSRERDVLALVADGHPNREIAVRLGISEHTVKFHLASVFGKLGASTRTQAVRRALEWGLIDV